MEIQSAGPRPGAVLAVCSLATFLAFLDVTIVTIAFPAITRSFDSASLLLGGGVALVSLAVVNGEDGDWAAPGTLGPLVGGVVLGGLFAWRSARVPCCCRTCCS